MSELSRRRFMIGVGGLAGHALPAVPIGAAAENPAGLQPEQSERDAGMLLKRLNQEAGMVVEANNSCSIGLQAKIPSLTSDKNTAESFVPVKDSGIEYFHLDNAALKYPDENSESPFLAAHLPNSTEVRIHSLSAGELGYIDELKKIAAPLFVQLISQSQDAYKVEGETVPNNFDSNWAILRSRLIASARLIPNFNPDLNSQMWESLMTDWFADFAKKSPFYFAIPVADPFNSKNVGQKLPDSMKEPFDKQVLTTYLMQDEVTGEHLFNVMHDVVNEADNSLIDLVPGQAIIAMPEDYIHGLNLTDLYMLDGSYQNRELVILTQKTETVKTTNNVQPYSIGIPFVILDGIDTKITPIGQPDSSLTGTNKTNKFAANTLQTGLKSINT